jgi:DNA repair exonuclease SbcCD nuclease subunit
MAKILICGDKHLKITRFEQSKQLLQWIEKEIEINKPDMYVCLGDDMDSHAILRAELMAEFNKHIDIISQKIPVVYILGNHDYFKPKDSTYHSMQTLIGKKNFYVIDKPTELMGMTFIPYMPKHEDFPKQINTEIVLAHQTFLGADYGHVRPDDGVDISAITDKLFISGHIHKRQQLSNAIYPGSPYAMSIDDLNQIKGFYYLTLLHLIKPI